MKAALDQLVKGIIGKSRRFIDVMSPASQVHGIATTLKINEEGKYPL